MAIKKNDGRQCPIASITTVTFGTGADVAAQGVFPIVDLPQDAVIVSGYLVVSDATTAGVTVSIGTTGAPTSVLGATAADALAKTDVTVTGLSIGAATTLVATVAGATPVAPGVAELVLTYVVKGRAEFTQG